MSDNLPEESLSAWGTAFFWLGILSGVVCLWAALIAQGRGINWYLVAIGIGVFLQAMFIRMLLQAGAEIILLLRRLNGTGADIIILLRKLNDK